jgi:hypothetical protein
MKRSLLLRLLPWRALINPISCRDGERVKLSSSRSSTSSYSKSESVSSSSSSSSPSPPQPTLEAFDEKEPATTAIALAGSDQPHLFEQGQGITYISLDDGTQGRERGRQVEDSRDRKVNMSDPSSSIFWRFWIGRIFRISILDIPLF